MSAVFPPPFGPDWKVWARQLSAYLARKMPRLEFKTSTSNPSENGIILWDDTLGYPVVSSDGEWRQIVLVDGHYYGAVNTTQNPAAANTAYTLTYTPTITENITNGTPASRIVFQHAGHYMVTFSAQIHAGASSSLSFYFWPRINGVDIAGSTMVNTLKSNNMVVVVGRSATFLVNAGDYLEAAWAVDNTSGELLNVAATAFCPAAPASTIGIIRVQA
jgi:hypothetical protein